MGTNASSSKYLIKCSGCASTIRVRSLQKQVVLIVTAKELGESLFYLAGSDLKGFIDDELDSTSFQTDKNELIDQVMSLENIYVEKVGHDKIKIRKSPIDTDEDESSEIDEAASDMTL